MEIQGLRESIMGTGDNCRDLELGKTGGNEAADNWYSLHPLQFP